MSKFSLKSSGNPGTWKAFVKKKNQKWILETSKSQEGKTSFFADNLIKPIETPRFTKKVYS